MQKVKSNKCTAQTLTSELAKNYAYLVMLSRIVGNAWLFHYIPIRKNVSRTNHVLVSLHLWQKSWLLCRSCLGKNAFPIRAITVEEWLLVLFQLVLKLETVGNCHERADCQESLFHFFTFDYWCAF